MSLIWEGETDFIRGERRAHRRYAVELRVRYRAISRGRAAQAQAWGKVRDVSSSGIFFTAAGPIPCGTILELIIDWPVAGAAALELVLAGEVVRSAGASIALRTTQRKFRRAA